MTKVETSRDGVVWDADAKYSYYPHGPLRRVEVGEDGVQGLDMTYTIQGQLKAINEKTLDKTRDPGRDGDAGPNSRMAADSFAIHLQYNPSDFSATASPFNSNDGDDLRAKPLYDGNISALETHIGKKAGLKREGLSGESFRYDQLGRLDSAQMHAFNAGSSTWDTAKQEYFSRYKNDPNGNLVEVIRHGYGYGGSGTTTAMDSLTYSYPPTAGNKLDAVADAVTGEPYPGDLANQAPGYEYDPVGRLVDENGTTMAWDSHGRLKQIALGGAGGGTIGYAYDAAGNRVRKSVATSASTTNTYYVYDATSTVVAIYEELCVAEPPKPPRLPLPSGDIDGDGWADSVDCEPLVPNPDWDDRDVDGTPDVCDNCPCTGNPSQDDIDGDGNGNACDTTFTPINPPPPPGTPAPDGDEDGDGFKNDEDPCPCDASNMCTQCPIQLVELPIYGLGRVGVSKPTGIVLNTPANTGPTYSRPIGEKFYELADHLGNVRMVISDIKRSMMAGGVPGKFFADVHAYMNAYPYGMPMPGRWWDSALAASPRATYRYGYNGMEGDPEVLGEGNHFTTPFREYDPRVARWWSNDPVVHPWESPYAAMGGNPVRFTDPLGLDTSIFDEANDYEREVRKGGRDMIIVRASRLKEDTPSSSPEAREEATQQENLANAQRAWGATKDRLSAVLDADYARRDRENSSVGQDLSWHIQDLLNLGVVGLSDSKYLERGIVRCQTCDFVPGISLIRAGLVIKSDGLTFESGLGLAAAGFGTLPVAGLLDDAGRIAGRGILRTLRWSSKSVKSAADDLAMGASEVLVGSRQEAEELFLGLFQGHGYRNSTGMSATEAKEFFGGKAFTYHWDDALDEAGRILGHGSGNAHGGMPHLQIHPPSGSSIRIFFPQ